MNKIIIKNLQIKATHGCNPDEKINPQRFLFSAEIFYDFSQAAKSDDLTKTISYSDVKKTLTAFCVNNCFDLIETLATRACDEILKKYPARFALCGLPVVKIGINFDAATHTISDWEIAE